MMRNVAIGAVLGFGLVVLLLSIFGSEAPPPAPPAPAPPPMPAAVAIPAPPQMVAVVPPAAPAADAGAVAAAPTLTPLNVAPVVVPSLGPATSRQEMLRQVLSERRKQMMGASEDAGSP